MRDFPKLSWLNAKQFKHNFGDRKNMPSRKPEHEAALQENVLCESVKGTGEDITRSE